MLRKLFSTLLFISLGTLLFAQPANNNCNTAQSLGSLPTPAACPSGDGAPVSVSGTTVGATAANPYNYLLGCQPAGNQAAPALDVWYSFVATGTVVNINMSGSLASPNVAMWTGTNCNNLVGFDCAIGSNAGNLSVTFQPTTPGQTYYLQVSGNNATSTGTFTLTVDNDNDCNNCLQVSNLTVSPSPTNGTYAPNTTVTFCYTITSWTQVVSNWLHGITPSFGCGWDLTTLTSSGNPPPGGSGYSWHWGNGPNGWGWWVDYDPLGPGGPDGIYTNNYGDPTISGTGSWTWCWSVTTKSSCACADLSMTINTTSDGETGNWTSVACQGDPVYQFSAAMSCCAPPTMTQTNVTCFGACTGSATATPTGNVTPWDYVWTGPSGVILTQNNLAGPSTTTNLCAGTYTVSVTDNNGCTSSATVTITQPPAITNTSSQVNVTCNGLCNGSASVVASGGNGTYTYSWAPSGGTGATASGLCAGTYTCTISSPAGCTHTQTFNITQPPAITLSGTQVNVTCNGVCNGSATTTVVTGTGPFTYAWTPSGGSAATANGLCAGTYTCTVTGLNSCTATQTFNITQPPAITNTSSQVNLTCNSVCNGSASVVASGGTGTYTYAWSPSGGTGATANSLCAGSYTCTISSPAGCTHTQTFSITQPPAITSTQSQVNVTCNGACNGSATVNASGGTGTYTYSWAPSGGTGATASGLCAGTYTCTISSPAGCTATASFNITQPPAITSTQSQVNVTCNGSCNGSATVVASGGTGIYTYSWAPSGGTGATASSLCAGTYTCTISSPAGCTATASFNITQPPAITSTQSQVNVTCAGSCNGSASVVASGGNGTYTYAWSPSGGTGATASSLCAGSYTCTISSPAGCTATASFNITAPPAITSTQSQVNITCNGACNGSASVVASGGTGTYTYAWTPSGGTGATASSLCVGNYTCTISSPAGCTATASFNITQPPAITNTASQVNVTCNGSCNGSATVVASGGTGTFTYAWAPSGGTGATASSLCAGTYTCTISSPAGCTHTQTFNITQPPAITSTQSQTNVSCNGSCNGTATVVASGGTGTYTYAWTPSGGTGATASGLCAGTYTCTISSPAGCTATATFNITQPTALTASNTTVAATCGGNNGSATATPSGGTGPYTYSWAPSGGTGATASSLTAGSYTCTITDANSCTVTTVANVTTTGSITAAITATVNVTCFGGNNGSATATPSGGSSPYTYAWSPSGGTGATGINLVAGNYTVTVTDANLCVTTATVAITQPPAITNTSSQVNVTCNGSCNGSASVVASGGTGTYTYAWTPSGGTGATASALCAGSYTCTISSPAGCTHTQTFNITQPAAITATQSQVNVNCNAACNGSGTVVPSGGVGPYTYAWTPSGGTGATASSLCAGTYTCTITDANGCTLTKTFTITQPTAITATTSNTPATCGNNNGSATVTPSGGTGPYTYSWAPTGGTGSTASSLTAGNYTCTITDANLCTFTITVIVPNAGSPTATITSSTNIACFGACTGSATVAGAGGTLPYSYSWSPSGGTGTTASALCAGTYTVTVTDANGCFNSATVSITQPPAITDVPSQVNVTCNAVCNGSATVVASGGTGTYTYAWAPSGGTGATASALCAGSYTCTISSPAGCTHTQTFSITQPTALTANATSTPVSCNGGNNGTATVTAGGGTSPFTYSWAPAGGTGSTASNLTAQTYTCTVTDANGCTITATTTVTQPTALSASTTTVTATCGNANGSATVIPSGGTGPYTYSWAPSGGTGATASGLLSNIYTATVTDANNCTVTAVANVPNAGSPTVTITATVNVSCFGGNNGSATCSASGGVSPYTYAWTPTGGTGATGTALTAGNYTVTVTDANGCSAQATVAITQPTQLTASASSTAVLCNGGNTGSATVAASGGVTAYTYAWAPSGGTGSTASGIPAATYTCTVTDANGCTATATTTVTQPSALTASASSTPVSCNGGNNGTATVMPGGGTMPYTYAWTPSGGTGATAAGLNAQTYTCTVTDANGCTITATTTVTQPTALTASTTTVTATCGNPNGSATVIPAGGTGPYTYSWAPTGGTGSTASGLLANTYTVTVTDANNCTVTATAIVPNAGSPTVTITATVNVSCNGGNNGSATSSAAGGVGPYTYAWSPSGGTGATGTALIAGNYTVTVTDANNCTATATVAITQPTALTATASTTPVLCNGGSTGTATVNASGGTGPYTYAWTPTGGTGSTASGLSAQAYSCFVTDANGCTTTANATVTQPSALTETLSNTPVGCNGGNTGTASVLAGGGVGPYTYAWTPIGGTGTTALNLTAQTYTCTVTDANGCTMTASTTVTEPTALTATTSTVTATCGNANGSATVNASGGTAPYTYNWLPSGGTGTTAPNLSANTYTCTVTDFNGCTFTVTAIVPNAGSPSVNITATVNVLCNGGNNGSLTSSASGGTGPYTYAWSPSGGTGVTGSPLTAGNYTVTVTDANGCTATASATVTEPGALSATAVSTPVSCNGGNNGSATATPNGGVGPYTYSWSPIGGTGITANNLTAQAYTCTVTDVNGCTTTASVAVSEPSAITTTASQVDEMCFNGNTASASVNPAGGIGPYTYAWSPAGGTGSIALNLTAQNYTCTITDQNGCSLTQTFLITEPALLTVSGSGVDTHCNQADGSVTANGVGGTGAITYAWQPGGNGQTLNNIGAGTYIVTATDQNGCTASTNVTVNNINGVIAALGSSTNIDCFGNNTGSIDIVAAGGNQAYTYTWTPNVSSTSTASSIGAGTYSVDVTDADGCVSTVTVTLTEPSLLSVTASANPAMVCAGTPLTLTCTPTGGTPAYNVTWNPGNLSGTTQTFTPTASATYTVDVVDANGCTAQATTSITVAPMPVPALSGSITSGCAPLCVNFTDMSTVASPGQITAWTWDFGDGNTSAMQSPTHCYDTPGNYNVTLTVKTADGCQVTITMTNYISVFANPVAAFGATPQPTTIFDPEIFFTDSSINANSWLWSFGDVGNSSSTLQNPSFSYPDVGCYQVLLTVTSVDGCLDTATHEVCITPDVAIYVPNAFTPDGNALNETFFPVCVGIDPDKYEMWIFDRWGNMIFYTDDLNKGWNGKVQGQDNLVQIDTYVWKIAAVDINGGKHNLIGKVSVIR